MHFCQLCCAPVMIWNALVRAPRVIRVVPIQQSTRLFALCIRWSFHWVTILFLCTRDTQVT